MKDILPIIAAALGSSALFSFLQFLITRKDGRADALKKIDGTLSALKADLDSIKRDNVRTQLLLLISDYPDRTDKIFELAEAYFVKLGGNWYMSSIFNQWLEDQSLTKPDWYKH